MASPTTLTKGAINRAGKCLRDLGASGRFTATEIRDAWVVLLRYRSEWSDWPHPLTKVNMGLRSMAQRASTGSARVTQRLKRTERIIDKLRRYESMNLAQMQDIGGCRVVVPKLVDLSKLRKRIERTWKSQIVDIDDYVATPRKTGYRALHVIVERDGHMVEIQLRTQLQHRWAASVEYVESRNRTWTREGDLSGSLAEAFRQLGLALEHRDRGEQIPEELSEKLKHWLGAFEE